MYDNFDTPVHLDRPLANQYLPDVRTLAACSLEALYLELPATTPCYQEGVAADEASALYLSLVRGSYAVLDAVPSPSSAKAATGGGTTSAACASTSRTPSSRSPPGLAHRPEARQPHGEVQVNEQ